MDSNGGQKKINVGVLSLSKQSVVASFISELKKKKSQDDATFNPIFIQLSVEDLENPQYKVKNDVEAVVLLHSTLEGRLSLTNVPDARYNILLPSLGHSFGSKRIGVIAHSLPSLNDLAKSVQMKSFETKQYTTFKKSGCVIICGKLAEMSKEWEELTNFLALAPNQPKPQPSDAAEKPISREKLQRQKSANGSPHQMQASQAYSDPPRKQMKADGINFVIITSEGDSVSVDVIKDDICKKASRPITIVTSTTNNWEAAWKSANALALLLQDKDLVELRKKISPEKRRNIGIFRPVQISVSTEGNIGNFRPVKSLVSTEGREPFEVFEYEVRGDCTADSYIQFSKNTLIKVVSWLDTFYQDRSEERQ